MVLATTRALILACGVLPSFGQLPADLNEKLDAAQRNAKIETVGPLDVAPEPNASERGIRITRNRLHNLRPLRNPCTDTGANTANRAKAEGCVPMPPTLEELPEGVPGKITHVDLPPLSALPVSFSDTIVIGVADRVQPYFSEDRRNIYTEYSVTVSEVLHDGNMLGVTPGSRIALDRMGGSVRLASGRVLQDVVHGQSAPLVIGHKYVLFLNYDARGTWFRCMKSWELWQGVAIPVDPVDVTAAQRGTSPWAGKSEADIINAIRDAVRGMDVR